MSDGLPDLHRHLDGSLRPATLRQLAEPLGVEIPDDLLFRAGMGLEAALESFGVTLATLQTEEAVERVASEICEDAAADGVTTLEIRFAPQLHRSASMERIVDAALSGIGSRAGLILCGLYGESPAVLEEAVEIATSRPGVVAIDLAGGPASDHAFRLEDYRAPFERAAAAGLGRTVHAAEGRPPEEIRVAVEVLGAQRVGHGVTLLDDEAVLELVLEREIVIEACPTSNLHTGAIAAIEDHPLAKWLELGVRACVNTDNTLLSDVTGSEEHRRARRVPGMTDALLEAAIENGHRGAFSR